MKDDARQAAELEALQAEFAAYRTEAEATIADLQSQVRGLRQQVKDGLEEPIVGPSAKKPRKPRPTKGK